MSDLAQEWNLALVYGWVVCWQKDFLILMFLLTYQEIQSRNIYIYMCFFLNMTVKSLYKTAENFISICA